MKRRFYNSFSGSSRHFGGSSEGEESSQGVLLLLTLFPLSLQCTVTLKFSLKVMDKLAKISKLKEEVAGGKQLEKNQLEMISKEKELTEELKMLQL